LKDSPYFKQAELMLKTIPHVAAETCFALKRWNGRARETLVETLRKELTNDERQFLVSLKAGQPKWDLVGIDGIEKFPAVQWKLTNVQKMSARKQRELLTRLMRVLDL
jgi:hypothetical protein